MTVDEREIVIKVPVILLNIWKSVFDADELSRLDDRDICVLLIAEGFQWRKLKDMEAKQRGGYGNALVKVPEFWGNQVFGMKKEEES